MDSSYERFARRERMRAREAPRVARELEVEEAEAEGEGDQELPVPNYLFCTLQPVQRPRRTDEIEPDPPLYGGVEEIGGPGFAGFAGGVVTASRPFVFPSSALHVALRERTGVEELGRDVGELEAGLPQVLQRLKKQSLAQAILDAYGHLADLEARLDILEQPEPPAPPVVHDVIVVPNAFPLAVGDVLALGATVLADDGYAGGVLTWTSSNAAAATVVAAMDGTAQVTGVAPGDARITAEIGGQSAAVGVSVVRRQATKGGGKTAARRAARGPAKTAAKGGAGRRRGGTQPPEPAP